MVGGMPPTFHAGGSACDMLSPKADSTMVVSELTDATPWKGDAQRDSHSEGGMRPEGGRPAGDERCDLWDGERELARRYEAEIRRSDMVHAKYCNDLLEVVGTRTAAATRLEEENAQLRGEVARLRGAAQARTHSVHTPSHTNDSHIPAKPTPARNSGEVQLRARCDRPALSRGDGGGVGNQQQQQRQRGHAAHGCARDAPTRDPDEHRATIEHLRGELARANQKMRNLQREAATSDAAAAAAAATASQHAAALQLQREVHTLRALCESQGADLMRMRAMYDETKAEVAGLRDHQKQQSQQRVKQPSTRAAAPPPSRPPSAESSMPTGGFDRGGLEAANASLMHRLKVATQDFKDLDKSHAFLQQQVQLGKQRYVALRQEHQDTRAQLAAMTALAERAGRLCMTAINDLYTHATPSAQRATADQVEEVDRLLTALVEAGQRLTPRANDTPPAAGRGKHVDAAQAPTAARLM